MTYETWWYTDLNLMEPSEDPGCRFENGTFMRTFRPEFVEDMEDYSRQMGPCFLFKPTGFEVEWVGGNAFKHTYMNQDLSPREIMHIMELCRMSLEDQ